MIVSAMVAMDRAAVIGDRGQLPWHLPRDLKRFRRLTLGKPLIMGRRTFESLPAPLDRRLSIVLTRAEASRFAGCRIARTVAEALSIAQEFNAETGGDEAMVIGGAGCYAATVDLWDRLLITLVDGEFRGDTYFPLGRLQAMRWLIREREFCESDAKNPHAHWFLALDRDRSNGTASTLPDLLDLATKPSASGVAILEVQLQGGPADGRRMSAPDDATTITLADLGPGRNLSVPPGAESVGPFVYEITDQKRPGGAVVFQYVGSGASARPQP